MTPQPLTMFAPAGRKTPLEIKRQGRLFGSLEMHELSAAIPVVFLVLNTCRQIVCTNQLFVDLVGSETPNGLLGQRPGEALGCVNAAASPSGCGTHEFCSSCGAVNAILASLSGTAAVKECVISCGGGKVLELRVWATPMERGDERFTIFSAVDISHENRRKILERTFFHDISNTVVGIYGTAELMTETQVGPVSPEVETILHASEWLMEEIKSHKKLVEAEIGELSPQWQAIPALKTLQQCLQLYTQNRSLHGRELGLDANAVEVTVDTDPVLLRRILINMIKNALEATPEGGRVHATCYPDGGLVCFSVSNPGFMPRQVQRGLFNRTFSTKGIGRGVGTYAMKLFAERYLGGRIGFTTSPEEGTMFTLTLPLING